jgi:prepilin-type processing-associated H-X9-DG protein
MTGYVALVGKSAAFEGKSGIRMADITDGLSNTIMIVETDKEIPWTKPEDVAFDADKKLLRMGGLFDGGFNALFGDGSVRFIAKDTKEATLKAMITRDGAEVIGNEDD